MDFVRKKSTAGIVSDFDRESCHPGNRRCGFVSLFLPAVHAPAPISRGDGGEGGRQTVSQSINPPVHPRRNALQLTVGRRRCGRGRRLPQHEHVAADVRVHLLAEPIDVFPVEHLQAVVPGDLDHVFLAVGKPHGLRDLVRPVRLRFVEAVFIVRERKRSQNEHG